MFWCIVRFSSFDFFFHFVSVCLCFVFSSLYRSLNILFVFAYNWMFLLALSRLFASTKVLFCEFVCFVDGVFFYDPRTLLRSLLVFLLCVCVCGCCLLILSHLNIWINVLDFHYCFSMILFFLLFCLECKSSRVFLVCSYLSTSFSLFLCYFCFNLSGCLFSLKLTC